MGYLAVSLSWYHGLFDYLFLLVPWVIWLSLSPGTMGYFAVNLFPLVPLVIWLSLFSGTMGYFSGTMVYSSGTMGYFPGTIGYSSGTMGNLVVTFSCHHGCP